MEISNKEKVVALLNSFNTGAPPISDINPTKYIQHNPSVGDGLQGFGTAMKRFAKKGLVMEFTKLHKVLDEGNLVLSISEGCFRDKEDSAVYDLFRLENGQIVEHWDEIAPIPSKEKWENQNGKF